MATRSKVAKVPEELRYPGQLGAIHGRMTKLQDQLDRIEVLLSK